MLKEISPKSSAWKEHDLDSDTRLFTYAKDIPSCGIESISIKQNSTSEFQIQITTDSKDAAHVLCNKLSRESLIPIKIVTQDDKWILMLSADKTEIKLAQFVKSLHEFAPYHIDQTLWQHLAKQFSIALPDYPGPVIPYKSNYSAPTIMRKISELAKECKMTQWFDTVQGVSVDVKTNSVESKNINFSKIEEREFEKAFADIARYGMRVGINDMEKCGKGAYAEEDIPEKVFVAEYEGERKDFNENLTKDLRDYGYRVIEDQSGSKKEICIDAIEKGGKGRFFQHLRPAGTIPDEFADANLEAVSIQSKSGVRVFFRTKRAIKRGELLGFSYVSPFLEGQYFKDRGFTPCVFTKVGWHSIPITEVKDINDKRLKPLRKKSL